MYRIPSRVAYQYQPGTASDPHTWQPHDIVQDRKGKRRAMVITGLDEHGHMRLMNIAGADVRRYEEFDLGLAAITDGYGFQRVDELRPPNAWPLVAACSLYEDSPSDIWAMVNGA